MTAKQELQDEVNKLRVALKETSERFNSILREKNREIVRARAEIDRFRTKLEKSERKFRRVVKNADKALREREKLYRAIVEDQTELVCRALPEGTHTFVNHAYCQYFQKSREELLSCSFLQLVPLQYRDELKRKMNCLNIDHPVMVHEQRTIGPDGKERWQQWNNRAIFDDSGRIIEFQAVGRDITNRKKMEDALKESENTLRKQKKSLEEKNTALKEVLEQIGMEKKAIREQVLANVEELLIPIINKLRLESTTVEKKYLDLFSRTLDEIASSFGQQISRASLKLTTREIEICNMIKTGLSSKEIAELLHISLDTVGRHRNSIRKKFNLIDSKQNLSTFLKSLPPA